jgi:hypothetical protein
MPPYQCYGRQWHIKPLNVTALQIYAGRGFIARRRYMYNLRYSMKIRNEVFANMKCESTSFTEIISNRTSCLAGEPLYFQLRNAYLNKQSIYHHNYVIRIQSCWRRYVAVQLGLAIPNFNHGAVLPSLVKSCFLQTRYETQLWWHSSPLFPLPSRTLFN